MRIQLRRRIENGLRQNFGPIVAMIVLLVVTMVLLRSMGRLWWCDCGEYYPWTADVWTRHNSQHLFDAYSFTHVLHGLIGYGVFDMALAETIAFLGGFGSPSSARLSLK